MPLQSLTAETVVTVKLPDLNPDQLPCRHAYVPKIPGAQLLPESEKKK